MKKMKHKKKMIALIIAAALLIACAATYFLLPEKVVFPVKKALYSEKINDLMNDYVFSVDATKPGGTLPNLKSNINVFGGRFAEEPARNTENDPYAFIDYIQLMECSGGSKERDLFKDPDDFSVTDDYDFSPLLRSCKGILSVGAKPLLKLGNVPKKLSVKTIAAAGAETGDFSVNVYPPDDYNAYYAYIKALAEALVAEFGLDEVRAWRFGVLTEYENAGWFRTPDEDPKATAEAFCKLYDYTAEALIDVLGEDVFIGAHSMTVSEGLWDEREFIRHCGKGTNFATGKTGTRLCYLAGSYYEHTPGGDHKGRITLPEVVSLLRGAAEEAGLPDLLYGIDEGRVLVGQTPGRDSDELLSRTVGYTYQAGFDARLIKQGFDSGLDYFSSWAYCSEGFTGLPTVSYYVAELAARFEGESLLPEAVEKKGWLPGAEVAVSAALDEDAGLVRVMAYNYKNSLYYLASADTEIRVKLPENAGDEVRVTVWTVDDDCNWFDEWNENRKELGFPDEVFAWSPDDGNPLFADADAAARFHTLQNDYRDEAKLTPETYSVKVENGECALHAALSPNAVAFFELAY